MITTGWDELPEALRRQVDDLVRSDSDIQAVFALCQAGLGIPAAKDLIHARREALADEIRHRPQQPRDAQTLIQAVQALPTKTVAIEAVWDGDTRGWFVQLFAIAENTHAETGLAQIAYGGDLRVFNGEVPPWPEAQEAVATGAAVARHFGIPFHFASPDEPTVDTPRWTDLA